jgi:hypothetical protein
MILACSLALVACNSQQPKPDPKPQPKPAPVVQVPEPPDKLAMLAVPAQPERDRIRERHRYDRAIETTKIDGLRYYFFEPDREPAVVGFSLRNDGSPNINPVGLKKKGAMRQYTFLFPDRARENVHLAINDDVKVSGRFSHDNMFRELHFFPRKQLPSLKVVEDERRLQVMLPTGEPVLFDLDTLEIADGVLAEAPIDFNRSRHQRKNPVVDYRGDFLAISVEQRGEAPRRAKVWGQNKLASVYYPSRYSRACRLSPKYIWDQTPRPGDTEPKLHMLHATDDSLFAAIEKQCGWDLSALRDTGLTRQASLSR